MNLSLPGADGLRLAGECVGDGLPVLLLHGGGQTRHAWGPTAARLATAGWQAIAIDQRGHGDSDWAPPEQDYRLECYGEDLAAAVRSLAQPVVLVGASLGGLAALMVAGELAPECVEALVLVDIAVRPEPHGVDRVLAFMEAHDDGFSSLDEAAAAVAAYLPHRPRPARSAGLARNLRRREDGRWYWHWDPRFLHAARAEPPEAWEPRLRAAAARLHQPTLLVRGGLSDVLSEAGARDFLALVPHARYASVSDAAHMVAGDRNDRFTAAVLEFLASSAPPTRASPVTQRSLQR
ncbi:MAG: alpha/beta hydrolase [Gammaproteobacteria bacterium]|nr:alpha/beta hydrolase [Gammaproteobacteria bacterium]TVQ48947.1 MAG: alpha/beta hydrolase [Gammaproteobacteria bacterium]